MVKCEVVNLESRVQFSHVPFINKGASHEKERVGKAVGRSKDEDLQDAERLRCASVSSEGVLCELRQESAQGSTED